MNATIEHTATPADVLAGRARWCVVEGDCADVLRALPDGGVDALVSDPPSGIAFMGAEWDRDKGGRLQWVAWLTGILSDARRATRDGGRAIVWSLPRTSHWTGCAVEDAGWSIETTIAHLFGTGWPKGKAQTKPAQETWWLARTGRSEALNIEACRVGTSKEVPASLSKGDGLAAWSERPGRRGASMDDPGRDPTVGRYPPNLVLSHAAGCVREGTRRVATGESDKPWTAGRGGNTNAFGAATVRSAVRHGSPDGTESVEAWRCVEGECPVAELDRQSGERTSGTGAVVRATATGHQGNAHGVDSRAEGTPCVTYGDTGTASRYFPQFPADSDDAPWSEALFRYVAKPSRGEKNEGCEALPQGAGAQVALGLASKIMRCAECRRTHGVTHSTPCVRCGGPVALDDAANDGAGRDGCRVHANTHPTVKSVALMRWLLRLVTKPGDVVLDPFGGSGTTGVAALLEGRRVILVEREPQYAAIARARCAAAEASIALASQPALFATP